MTDAQPRFDAEELLAQAPWVRRLARRLLGDAHAAEDVVQDTWMVALSRAPSDARGERLRAWCLAVARKLALRRRRSETSRRDAESRVPLPEPPSGTEVERMQQQRVLADAVLELREPYRTAVILRYLDDRSYAELAERQGIGEAAARQRVSRGVAMLRARLDERFGDRAAWCSALACFGDPMTDALAATSVSVGGIAMGTKAVLTAAASGVLVLGIWVWRSVQSPAAPEPATQGVEGLPAVGATAQPADATPDSADGRDNASDRRTARAGQLGLGALAGADRLHDLHGRVLDAAGHPIAGARIEISRRELDEYSSLDVEENNVARRTAEVESDHLGEFAIALERGRPYGALVSRPGYASVRKTALYAGQYVDFVLTEPAAFAGRVLRRVDAAPVEGVSLRGITSGALRVELFRGETDASGRFHFDDLAAGPVVVQVVAPGLANPPWLDLKLEAGQTAREEFVLSPGYLVRGTVRDAETGAPIADAVIGEGWTFRSSVRSDAHGRYEFPGFAESGVYEVGARAAGYGERILGLPTDQGGEIELDFELEPAQRARGRVVDAAGEPLSDVYVAAVASASRDGGRAHDWVASRTAADGSFEIRDIRRDLPHALFVRKAGKGTRTYDFPAVSEDVSIIELGTCVLHDGGLLGGVVVDEKGEPVPLVRLELIGANADRLAWSGAEESCVESHVDEREGVTDDLGRFAFGELSEGEYRIEMRDSRLRDRASLTVSVAVGEVRDDLRLQVAFGLTISGRVVDAAGEPVAGVVLNAQPESGEGESGLAWTRADGGFEIQGLDDTSYSVQAFPTEMGQGARGVSVSETTARDVRAGETQLEIVLATALPTAGRVVDSEGEPVVKATVAAYEAGGEMLRTVHTDTAGRFQLNLAPGLAVDLRAWSPPGGQREFWRVGFDADHAAELLNVTTGAADLVLTLPSQR